MDDLKIYGYTGRLAKNLKIAARINRRLRATQRLGLCTLVLWGRVEEVDGEFVRVLTRDLRPDKTLLGGLSSQWQDAVPPGFNLPPPPPDR